MYFYKVQVLLIIYLTVANKFFVSSVYFERKTNFQLSRDTNIVPVFTSSLLECAMRCVFRTKCVFFFYNHVDLLCQSEGKIYVSFTDGSGNYWTYYGKN